MCAVRADIDLPMPFGNKHFSGPLGNCLNSQPLDVVRERHHCPLSCGIPFYALRAERDCRLDLRECGCDLVAIGDVHDARRDPVFALSVAEWADDGRLRRGGRRGRGRSRYGSLGGRHWKGPPVWLVPTTHLRADRQQPVCVTRGILQKTAADAVCDPRGFPSGKRWNEQKTPPGVRWAAGSFLSVSLCNQQPRLTRVGDLNVNPVDALVVHN